MKPSLLRFFALSGTALASASCTLAPDYKRPELSMPTTWNAAQAQNASTQPTADWWMSFGDEGLTSLMQEAMAQNLDIEASLARIRQSEGALYQTGSSLLPQIDANVNASRDFDTQGPSGLNSAQGSLSISYALDLWGRYRSELQSSKASLRATEYDSAATMLITQSSVASTYFNIITLKDRLAISRESLEAAREILRIVEARFQAGAVSGLDVAQQRTALANIEAGIPSIESDLAANEHALAILLARAPQSFDIKTANMASVTLPAIAAGQPSSLLERRPDIRRAEAQLHAANADIGAARAAFFPSFDLGAGLSRSLVGGGVGTASSIAASVLAPIFSGGQLEGNLIQSNARKRELAATYKKTVLTAFAEVEDALIAARNSALRAESLNVAAREARRSYDLSLAAYKSGAIDFTSVLDAQRSWLSARDAAAQARLNQYVAAVNLFVALGGGWQS
jgi:multidrug efflux system outer membrane protein